MWLECRLPSHYSAGEFFQHIRVASLASHFYVSAFSVLKVVLALITVTIFIGITSNLLFCDQDWLSKRIDNAQVIRLDAFFPRIFIVTLSLNVFVCAFP